LFPLDIQLLPSRFGRGGPCRFLEQLPAFLSANFVIFVLSPAVEVVMFTNRSNIRQMKNKGNWRFSGARQNQQQAREGPWEQVGMPLA
jgi:hypothetical protein